MVEDRDDFYRRQAHDAQVHAQRAASAEDRASWLRLAQSWLALVTRKPASNDAEAFDDAVQQTGTHQFVSDSEQ
jgi:hypothetical protein